MDDISEILWGNKLNDADQIVSDVLWERAKEQETKIWDRNFSQGAALLDYIWFSVRLNG